MTTINIFSKRQRKLKAETADVFEYETLPRPFRVQAIQIIGDAIGAARRAEFHGSNASWDVFHTLHEILCREYGEFDLAKNESNPQKKLREFMLIAPTDRCLDVIELCLRTIDTKCRSPQFLSEVGHVLSADNAIKDINYRFFEHSLGYQFESMEIIKVDSKLMHSEVIKPTLTFLSSRQFAGANEEFLKAHEHYRRGRTKECLTECLKAFESTMKAICDKRQWNYKATDTAKALIDALFDNKLIPDFMQSEFSALRACLQSGVPTVRNKQAAHGQGAKIKKTPPYMASFLLNTTASCILLLVEADKGTK